MVNFSFTRPGKLTATPAGSTHAPDSVTMPASRSASCASYCLAVNKDNPAQARQISQLESPRGQSDKLYQRRQQGVERTHTNCGTTKEISRKLRR